MIKKEITDKVNQLCYNLCENKKSSDCFRSLIHFVHSFTPAIIDFFSYKLSDLLINYLNSSV